MPEWFEIAEKLSYGRGKEAAVLGPPHDFYRVSQSGNPISSANRILQSVPVSLKPNAKSLKEVILNDKLQGITLLEVKADIVQYGLKVGDIGIQTDPVYGAGYTSVQYSTNHFNGLCLVSLQPNQKFVGIRLNEYIQIYRAPVAPANDKWGGTSNEALPLIIENGIARFGTVEQSAANIPSTLNILRPYGDKAFSETPGMPKKSLFTCFVPPIRGYQPIEGDRYHTPTDERYVVVAASHQDSGLVGSQVYLEKEIG